MCVCVCAAVDIVCNSSGVMAYVVVEVEVVAAVTVLALVVGGSGRSDGVCGVAVV